MKINKLILAGIIIVFVTGCTSNSNLKNPAKWSKDQASAWFDKKEWLGQSALQPDATLDKKEFAVQYMKNKAWWDKAFNFLKQEDLSALTVGVHELVGQDVFVKVTEYNTKTPEEVPFEAHKAYADIQYVVSGTEYIELTNLSAASLKAPYDAVKDIVLYNAKENQMAVGKSGIFFIILPNVLHRSGINVEESVAVKKIVIKVRI